MQQITDVYNVIISLTLVPQTYRSKSITQGEHYLNFEWVINFFKHLKWWNNWLDVIVLLPKEKAKDHFLSELDDLY